MDLKISLGKTVNRYHKSGASHIHMLDLFEIVTGSIRAPMW